MKIENSHTFKGVTAELLWKTLQDKEVLQGALPGCKSFEEVEEDVYDAELGINVGPVKGVFTAEVRQVEKREPEFYKLIVHGKGKPGEINANADMSLEDSEAGAVLTCSADVKVSGMLASVGQRVMGGVAKLLLGQFFKDIEKETKKIANL